MCFVLLYSFKSRVSYCCYDIITILIAAGTLIWHHYLLRQFPQYLGISLGILYIWKEYHILGVSLG